MADALHDTDTLAWSEQQADLLRRLAAGERVNDAVDWPWVIEEVNDVGQAQLAACRSLLRQAMIHLLKVYAWPESRSVRHWHEETGRFLDDAAAAFSPSMRQRIEVTDLYSKALRRVRGIEDDSGAARLLPDACPFTVESLLAGDVNVLLGEIAT